MAAALAIVIGWSMLRQVATSYSRICWKVPSDVKTIDAAVAKFRKDHGDWPETLEALVAPDENGWTYLDRRTLPLDPWKRPYRYDPPTETEARARVYTLGRDGIPGGAGDDADVDSWSISTPR